MNVAIDRLWKHYNGPTHYRAGHSVGEYSAYCTAGSFSFADMLHAVRYRSSIMADEIPPWHGGMLSIMDITKDEVLNLLSEGSYDIDLACHNSTKMNIVSGLTEQLLLFKKRLGQLNIDHTLVSNISIPCHSRFMNPCVSKMKSFLKNINVNLPSEPVVNGSYINDKVSVNDIIDGLSNQIAKPVKWVDTLQFLVRNKVTEFVVFGPPGGYYNMSKATFPELKTYLVKDIESLEKILILLNDE
jgi:[acyl-carrier-protein] S-malonyltransferase